MPDRDHYSKDANMENKISKPKIALLCDYGLDDAAATAFILERRYMFDKISILPIGGNMPLSVSMHNAKRVISNFGGPLENVILVDTSPVAQPEENLVEIHGKDGIGDIFSPVYEDIVSTVKYEEFIESLKDEIRVSLGPCTVTKDILERSPDHELIIMGGNISEKPNYGDYEFNHGMDPDAFSYCTRYKHTVLTLDSCRNPLCDFSKIEMPGNSLLEKFARKAVVLSQRREEESCYIYDLIAVQYLFFPERFEKEEKTDSFGNKLSTAFYKANRPIINFQ